MKLQVTIWLMFNSFGLGALLCEHLMLNGFRQIALILGVPAFVVTLVVSFLLNRHDQKSPQNPHSTVDKQ